MIKTLKNYNSSQNINQSLNIFLGHKYLDTIINSGIGLMEDSFICIAARPGTGKTTFAIDLVCRQLLLGHNILFFSLEMTDDTLISKILSRMTQKPFKSIHSKEYDCSSIIDRFNQYLRIDDNPRCTVQTIKQTYQDVLNSSFIPQIIILDHIGRLGHINSKFNQYQANSDNVIELRTMQLETKVPFIFMAQIHRMKDETVITSTNDKKKVTEKFYIPKLADLAETGKLEQECTNVISLASIEEISNIQEIQACTVLKNRYGPKSKQWDDIQMLTNREISSYKEYKIFKWKFDQLLNKSVREEINMKML